MYHANTETLELGPIWLEPCDELVVTLQGDLLATRDRGTEKLQKFLTQLQDRHLGKGHHPEGVAAHRCWRVILAALPTFKRCPDSGAQKPYITKINHIGKKVNATIYFGQHQAS